MHSVMNLGAELSAFSVRFLIGLFMCLVWIFLLGTLALRKYLNIDVTFLGIHFSIIVTDKQEEARKSLNQPEGDEDDITENDSINR